LVVRGVRFSSAEKKITKLRNSRKNFPQDNPLTSLRLTSRSSGVENSLGWLLLRGELF
jgi:hypothetical protein